jgi:tripartite-type tricarboxylate transporter receptor subunit TctC
LRRPEAVGARRLARTILLVCAGVALAGAAPAAAQGWPTHPVRIVSPFAPGGSSDTMGRLIAEQLGARLHQQFYVENRGGAGGLIGSAVVANAAPDGYTFLISSIGTHVIAPLTSANPGYDPIASFTHVAFVGGPPIVIAVHPSLGVKTFQELRTLLGSRSDALPYVSPGPGTIGHLIGEFWAEHDNLKLAHIAYKGSGQAITDLVAGHVKIGAITWTASVGQMRGGTIVPLAVSSTRRMPEFPDVPTLQELGYPELAVTTWFGFAAPAGLAPAITARMNEAIGAALDTAAVRARLDADGFETARMSPAALAAFLQGELAKWRPLAKKLLAAEASK